MKNSKLSNHIARIVALFLGAGIIAGVLPKTGARAATVVAPNENTSVSGRGAGSLFEAPGLRFQLVYDSGEFVDSMPLGGFIDQVSFRLNESEEDPLAGTIGSVEIRMSTSANPGTALSLKYQENVGSDELLVLPPTSVSYSAQPALFDRPNPFDIKFNLAQRFPYNPNSGSLLLDFFVHEPSNRTLTLDNTDRDANAIIGFAALTTAGRHMGMPVVQLNFEPVPEPSVVAFILVGTLAMILVRKKEKL